jgi:hypothetical protein
MLAWSIRTFKGGFLDNSLCDGPHQFRLKHFQRRRGGVFAERCGDALSDAVGEYDLGGVEGFRHCCDLSWFLIEHESWSRKGEGASPKIEMK